MKEIIKIYNGKAQIKYKQQKLYENFIEVHKLIIILNIERKNSSKILEIMLDWYMCVL